MDPMGGQSDADEPSVPSSEGGGGDASHDPPRLDLGESLALKGLFILALLYTLHFARVFLLPLFVALIGTFLLRPLVRWLRCSRLHLPEAVSAAGILLVIGLLIAYQAMVLREPLVDWLNEAPARIAEVQAKLRGPITVVRDATKQLSAVAKDTEAEPTPVVVVRDTGSGWGETLVTWIPVLIGYTVVTAILLFFLLAYGELFLLKVVRLMPTLSDKKNAVETAHMIERQTSVYLGTITVINIGLGAAIGAAMGLVGLPNPWLWGAMAGVLNFVPYLGALVGVIVVGLVGLTHFDSVGYALLAPLCYYVLTASEGYIVTPILLGRRLILNPVVVFLSLVFWGWLWGIPGMLLAVPVTAIVKIMCDQIKRLEAIGEFLGH
jgi:predicted PurR-regulated permease PerM